MNIWNRVLFAIIIVINIVRFVGLESSPPGFYIDEAAGASNILCMSQSKQDGWGHHLPFFAPAISVGYTTPVYLYSGALWTKIFGGSIGSLRALSALFTLLTIIGLGFLTAEFIEKRAALFVVLAASLSPWAFQFSRIAWDPPVMPCFLIWGIYFFMASEDIIFSALAGIFFALSLYCYFPARVIVPVLLVFLTLARYQLHGKKISWPAFLTFLIFLFGTAEPLISMTLHGKFQGRVDMVGIFSKSYLEANGGYNIFNFLKIFTLNFLKHFHPIYLFVKGDANLRHSTQLMGEWSGLDILALILTLIGVALHRSYSFSPNTKFLVMLAFLGYSLGVVPAALTWESIPHALRSIGCWPFLALFTGITLWKIDQMTRKALIPLTLLSSCLCALLIWIYFFVYPTKSSLWFDSGVKAAAMLAEHKGNWKEFEYATRKTEPLAKEYYYMRYGGQTCQNILDARKEKPNPDSE